MFPLPCSDQESSERQPAGKPSMTSSGFNSCTARHSAFSDRACRHSVTLTSVSSAIDRQLPLSAVRPLAPDAHPFGQAIAPMGGLALARISHKGPGGKVVWLAPEHLRLIRGERRKV